VPKRIAKARRGAPVFMFKNQDGREQKRNQKENMVEADPDVPDALAQVVQKLRQSGAFARLERQSRALWRQHPGLCGAAALETQQAAVRRVQVEEQAV